MLIFIHSFDKNNLKKRYLIYLLIHKVSILRYFLENWFINEYAREEKLDSWSLRVSEIFLRCRRTYV